MDDRLAMLKASRDVQNEVERAVGKHGEQHNLSDSDWVVIIAEELGEAAHHVSEYILGNWMDRQALDTEIVQTGAMVLRWLVEFRMHRE